MASHALDYSAPSVKVYSGNLVDPTIRCWCHSTPTGIGFVYEVPEKKFDAQAGGDLLDVIGAGIEDLVANHHVTGGQGAQDFDTNGLLADFVDLIVTYVVPGSPLPSPTAVAHVPVDNFFLAETGIGGLSIPGPGGGTPADIVDKTYDNLVAIAGGTTG